MSNVAIGTDTMDTSMYMLQVNGVICASQDVVALSDRRLKTNIKVIDNPMDRIRQISGYTYDRADINENNRGSKRYAGVIAQEVLNILPEAVYVAQNNDGYMSVAYSSLIAVIIEAIKDIDRRLAAIPTL